MTSPDDQTKDKVKDTEEATQAGADEAIAGVIEEDTVPELQVDLEDALKEVDKFKDMALRAEAELQNVRRRAERDVENAHKFGLEKFVANLLPVADSLEKSIEAVDQAQGIEDAAARAIMEGVGLCRKMLLDVMAKEGVAVVDPEGEPFDPNLHQAMSMVDVPDAEPGSVVAVVQKGYTLNGRLVRPAMVMVSRGSPSQDKPAGDGEAREP